jgi:hypothetical protein
MSHADTVPMTSQQLLSNAIDDSPHTRLQKVLHDTCSKSPQAFQLACDQLLIQDVDLDRILCRKRPIDSEDEDEGGGTKMTTSIKKTPRKPRDLTREEAANVEETLWANATSAASAAG